MLETSAATGAAITLGSLLRSHPGVVADAEAERRQHDVDGRQDEEREQNPKNTFQPLPRRARGCGRTLRSLPGSRPRSRRHTAQIVIRISPGTIRAMSEEHRYP